MGLYSKEELLEALISNKLIIPAAGGKYAVSTAISKNFKSNKGQDEKCLNYPEEFIGLGDDQIYRKVMNMCDIPLSRRNGYGKIYYTRTTTKESVSLLKQILKSPEIDFKLFISSIAHAYGEEGMLPGFAKMLTTGLWEEIYESGKGQSESDVRDRKGII